MTNLVMRTLAAASEMDFSAPNTAHTGTRVQTSSAAVSVKLASAVCIRVRAMLQIANATQIFADHVARVVIPQINPRVTDKGVVMIT